jgi:hypothetical protein
LSQGRYTADGVLARRAASRILRPYSKLLSITISEAWGTWHAFGADAPAARAQLGRMARAMNLSDFIRTQVSARFKTVRGCDVTWAYDRPVLVFAGGDLRVRLGKSDLDAVRSPQNGRQLSIWGQEDALAGRLPGGTSGTWAKCGYVLDPTETALARIVVTCHLEEELQWAIDLAASTSATAQAAAPMASSLVPPATIASASRSASETMRSSLS